MSKEVLVRSIRKSVLFIIVFFLIDLVLGSIAEKLYFSQQSGKFARLTHSIEEDNSEVLIFGSSHANRHYIPEIIGHGLKASTYNVGVQGQKLLFQTTLLKLILNNHKPSTIILNIDKDWLFESEEAYDRLSDFNPYFWNYREELYPVLSLKSEFTYGKMLFRSYRTNSTIVHIVKYFFSPQKDYDGYRPLKGTISNKAIEVLKKSKINRISNQEIDYNFVSAFREFIDISKKNEIDLIFVVSPSLDHGINENSSFELIAEIAKENDIPILNFDETPQFSDKYTLFNDFSHLNDSGAKLFSGLLVKNLIDRKLVKIGNE